MKTLAIISQKGGSGKTTIAVHMAVCAIRQGYHTAIIDIDPQGSAFDWYQSREVQNELNAVQAQAGQLAALLKQGVDSEFGKNRTFTKNKCKHYRLFLI